MEEAKEQTIEGWQLHLGVRGRPSWRGGTARLSRVANEPGTEHPRSMPPRSANAVVALGSCAVNGGWMARSSESSAGALGVQQYPGEERHRHAGRERSRLPGEPRVAGRRSSSTSCMMRRAARRSTARTSRQVIFNQTIHDNCQRRGHFENGEFVYEFGSTGRGYGLLPVSAGLPRSSDEGRTAGSSRWEPPPQLVRASPARLASVAARLTPTNPGQNWVEVNTPFYKRHRDLRIGDCDVPARHRSRSSSPAVVAGALVVHGFGMKMHRPHGRRRRLREGARLGMPSTPINPSASTTPRLRTTPTIRKGGQE